MENYSRYEEKKIKPTIIINTSVYCLMICYMHFIYVVIFDVTVCSILQNGPGLNIE